MAFLKKISPELRGFALTLNFYSSSAYNYVRKIFYKSLPHPSTIRKWYAVIDGFPGFTSESLNTLHNKVFEMKLKNKQLICGMMMDEFSIKQDVHFNGKRNQGYVNYGTGLNDDTDSLPLAKEALVLMLVALNSNWKIPIGYFLINGISGEEKGNLVKTSLNVLHDTGVIIKSLTFDGAGSNISMATSLRSKLHPPNVKTYFLHPITKSKDFFEKLVKLQEETQLHLATKIRHINYYKEKMKVRLAAQTLSEKLFDDLVKGDQMDFILSYKISQDHIKMFFSAIRSHGGFCNNPTASEFESAYKRLLIHTEIATSSQDNCVHLDETEILTVTNSSQQIESDSLEYFCTAGIDIDEEDTSMLLYLEQLQYTPYLMDITQYISGFVVRKIISILKYQEYAEFISESSITQITLIDLKNRGGLIKPSDDVTEFCRIAENVFRIQQHTYQSNS
ncbi:hypothetical protein AGLY_015516, partial [Aphis glycines]